MKKRKKTRETKSDFKMDKHCKLIAHQKRGKEEEKNGLINFQEQVQMEQLIYASQP